ncbi:hypothetical protein MRB53_024123 [Persea americana]|uniref:Uncharacterized protein n=1 Tax=Persea americana TaxID=3435 RepID=A0ACC2LC11_PERAE|nr:hypothetical protein MRB53_024123 [Persea americana]
MKLLLLPIFLHLSLLTEFPLLVQGCHENERAALLGFKSSLTDPTGRLSSWKGSNCCSWQGILCSNSSNVISIDLRNPKPQVFARATNSRLVLLSNSNSTAISGTISPSLFSLRHLRYLDLSFNNFHLSRIPQQVGTLKKLAYLNLSNSNISDSITTQFSNLSLLQSLDLSCSVRIIDLSSLSFNLSSLKISLTSVSSYRYNGHVSCKNLSWLRGLINLKELILDSVDLSEASASNWAESISVLHNLRQLHLSNCGISGPIPITQFLNLTHLSSLHMDFNNLSSGIPVQLANFSSLSSLDLSSSHVQGSIAYLPRLQEYYVDNNYDLIVDLDWMFNLQWPQLKKLSVGFTNVNGSIPPSISNISSLVSLKASGCSISGAIPISLSNLSNLLYLDLSFNEITGDLYPISGLRNLQVLILLVNKIGGPIPESICDLSFLEVLFLRNNGLKGRIPDCIGRLAKLKAFLINENSFESTIDSFFSLFQNSSPLAISLSLSGLTVKINQHPSPSKFQPKLLGLRSCNLNGKIPDFISNMTQLAYLDLGKNSLTGTIPYWLFKLPKLSFLDLSDNHLEGHLPPVLLHQYLSPTSLNVANNKLQGPIPLLPDTLEVLDLSRNNFTGEIPTQIGEMIPNARYISLSENQLTGPIPSSLCPQNNFLLKNVDFSKNCLSGTIPSSLGNCKSLISLNLVANYIIGNLPDELGNATNLLSLQFNDNHLDGPLPNVIRHLKQLEILTLGNNDFGGRIPTFISELQDLRILVLRSNSFNGSIPQEIASLRKLQLMDFSNNKLSGPIPNRLGGLSSLIVQPRSTFVLGYIIELTFAGVELEMKTCESDTDHIGSGNEKVVEEEDERDMRPLYGLVALGYGVGFFASFVWTMTVRGTQTSTAPNTFILSNIHHLVPTKLNGGNYILWKSLFEPILRAHSLLGFIDETNPCPSKFLPQSDGSSCTTPNTKYLEWIQQDQHLITWINSTLSETVLPYVVGLSTSKSIWDALSKRYSSLSRSHVL